MKALKYSSSDIVDFSEFLTPNKEFLENFIEDIYRFTPINEFKSSFSAVARASRNNQDVDLAMKERTQSSFRTTLSYVNNLLYHTSKYTAEQREEIGSWMHHEFISFCLLGTWPARSLNKPQHIAGDHHTIRQIYSNADQEKSDIGRVVNHCFLEEPACKAVKNRKNYIQNKILEKIQNNSDVTLITSVASGPAEEIFDVFDILGKENRHALKATGVDIDKRACASVDDRIYEKRLNHHFSTYACNILKLTPPPRQLQNQDLVYSMGLVDYFKDRATIKILNVMYRMLKPGGEAIIGNFHERCDSRVFLDYLLDWKLVYRTEDDMHRLFDQSLFKGGRVTVDFEEEGVNMLARCTKV